MTKGLLVQDKLKKKKTNYDGIKHKTNKRKRKYRQKKFSSA